MKERILDSCINWEFSPSSKTLRITGHGRMPIFTQDNETGLSQDNPFLTIKDEIETIIIEDGVTTISPASFWKCKNLKTLVAPNVLHVSSGAFYECEALAEVMLTDIITIGCGAFERCDSLAKISPDLASPAKQKIESLLYIDEFAFSGCKSLEKVIFPELKAVGKASFYHCDSLKIASCERLDFIAAHAFRSCISLSECRVHEGCLIADGSFEKALIQEPTKYIEHQ